MNDNVMTEKIASQFTTETVCSTERERRDRTYNRVARDQPAYIALLFPLICLLILLDFGKVSDSVALKWTYAFNIIISMGVCLPALFFFFKMAAREVSFIVEFIGLCFAHCFKKLSISTTCWVHKLSDSQRKDVLKILDKDSENQLTKDDEERIYIQIREDESVRDNPIVFEYNCFYGFYRNLLGGILIDLMLAIVMMLSKPSFCKEDSTMYAFVSGSWPWLVSLLILLSLAAYSTRIKLLRRRASAFCHIKEKSHSHS